jgi:RNA polymerase sigma-70 factor, ECF subfamily
MRPVPIPLSSRPTADSGPAGAPPLPGKRGDAAGIVAAEEALTFDAVYRTYARFVWRCVCRLGVTDATAEDVVQDVFMVVHRRLAEFEERTSLRAWLSAIVVHVVRTHRRTLRRKFPNERSGAVLLDADKIVDGRAKTPQEQAERDESLRLLYEILGEMQDDRREIFVLSELAELTAPEIAEALELNLNTVYFRIRTARREFEAIMFRKRAQEGRNRR